MDLRNDARKETKLDDAKYVLKQTQVRFMGHLITNEGVRQTSLKSKLSSACQLPLMYLE